MSLVVHVFCRYPEFGTNTNFDLVMAVNDKSGQMYDSGLHECRPTKFHDGLLLRYLIQDLVVSDPPINQYYHS